MTTSVLNGTVAIYFMSMTDLTESLLNIMSARETTELDKADYVYISLHTVQHAPWVFDHVQRRKPTHCKIMTLEVDIFSPAHIRYFYTNAPRTFDLLLHPWGDLPEDIKTSKVAREFRHVPTYKVFESFVPNVTFDGNGSTPDESRTINTVFVSSHPTDSRERIVKALQRHTEVACLGKAYNNTGCVIGGRTPGSQGLLPWSGVFKCLLDAYCISKYVLVIENVFVPGYVSEKLILAIQSGAVPIYFGAPDVSKYIDASLYVQGDPEHPEDVIPKIIDFDRVRCDTNGFPRGARVQSNVSPIQLRAQFNQDMWIMRRFADKPHGTFIDVGANDGLTYSNTWCLEQKGWVGVCIEPVRTMYDALVKNRPNSQCIHTCVYSHNGHVDFTTVSEDPGASMLSGVTQHIDTRSNTSKSKTSEIPCTTLNDMVDLLGDHVDFIKLDTEGSKHAILNAFDFNKYQVDVFCIECNHKEDYDKIDALMESKGYVLIAHGVIDYVYARHVYSDISRT